MALSGFNVVIIVLALGYVLDIFTRTASGKVGKTAIIILIIWSFAFVTGLSSSVTRATLMISLVMTGRLFNRNINTYNILFASAFFLLAISPALLTDVSFQLSFAAVTGILIYQPVAYRLLRFNNTLAARIWQMFTVTFAAQLSTLPFTLYYFHQFPVYFWLTNLYVIPWVSLIIILAGIYLLVSFLHPLALVTGNILELLLEGLYDAVKLTDRLPCALVENIYISIHQMILFFALTLFLGFFMLHRKNLFLMLTLSLFLIFQIISVTRNLNISHQQIFMVGNLKNRSAIGLISGRNGMMWINPNVSSGDNALQYAFLNFWIERGVSDQLHVLSDIELARDGIPGTESCCCLYPWLGQNLIMECNGWRIACIQDDQFFKHPFPSRLNLDLVVVSGRVKINPQGIKEWFDAKWIILDSSVSTYRASRWKKSCDWFCVPCWIVAEQGAFLLRLNKKGKVSKVNLSDSLPDDLGN
jgi:competence protein ComEC